MLWRVQGACAPPPAIHKPPNLSEKEKKHFRFCDENRKFCGFFSSEVWWFMEGWRGGRRLPGPSRELRQLPGKFEKPFPLWQQQDPAATPPLSLPCKYLQGSPTLSRTFRTTALVYMTGLEKVWEVHMPCKQCKWGSWDIQRLSSDRKGNNVSSPLISSVCAVRNPAFFKSQFVWSQELTIQNGSWHWCCTLV